MPTWVYFVGGGIILLFYFISIYNRLVALRHNVDQAWSNIDVLLKQRYEELPKLVETCKQYMQYEKGVLEEVTRLRNKAEAARGRADANILGDCEGALGVSISGLLARAEAYPELNAAGAFQDLTKRISDLQDSIADRQEFYNDAVNLNNIRREQFPDMIIAGAFSFGPRYLLKFKESEVANPDVKSLFNN